MTGVIMRISDFIETLKQYDQDTELVIDVDGTYITPAVDRKIVHFKHEYSGTSFTDNAIVLSK